MSRIARKEAKEGQTSKVVNCKAAKADCSPDEQKESERRKYTQQQQDISERWKKRGQESKERVNRRERRSSRREKEGKRGETKGETDKERKSDGAQDRRSQEGSGKRLQTAGKVFLNGNDQQDDSNADNNAAGTASQQTRETSPILLRLRHDLAHETLSFRSLSDTSLKFMDWTARGRDAGHVP